MTRRSGWQRPRSLSRGFSVVVRRIRSDALVVMSEVGLAVMEYHYGTASEVGLELTL